MIIYADTSFLVSLYIPESNSAEAERRISTKPRLLLTPLHRAEWAHAIEHHVFQNHISRREAEQLHREFERDCAEGVWTEIELPVLAFETCSRLARRHAARLGTRTLDTLHVASALELKAERFWTFDQRQSKLARAESLKTGA